MLFGKLSPLAFSERSMSRSNCTIRAAISPSMLKFRSSCNRPALRVIEVGSWCKTGALQASWPSSAPAFTTRVRGVSLHSMTSM